MKKRHVFAADSVRVAKEMVRAARLAGVKQPCIQIEARSDVEFKRISDELLNVDKDIVPAAMRGTLYGATAGFVLGLMAMAIPFFGVSFAGAAALAVVGALVGTWASVLMGAALPDEVRRTFQNEIDAGKVLVVIDAEPEDFAAVEAAIALVGGSRLPFESTTALTR